MLMVRGKTNRPAGLNRDSSEDEMRGVRKGWSFQYRGAWSVGYAYGKK